MAQQFQRAGGDHFVEIHVGRVTLRLEDIQLKLITPLSGAEFLGGADDRVGQFRFERAGRPIGFGRRPLDFGVCGNQRGMDAQIADAEIIQRPLRLRAVKRDRRNAHVAERIGFKTGTEHPSHFTNFFLQNSHSFRFFSEKIPTQRL